VSKFQTQEKVLDQKDTGGVNAGISSIALFVLSKI
jgi:hypothetical protein